MVGRGLLRAMRMLLVKLGQKWTERPEQKIVTDFNNFLGIVQVYPAELQAKARTYDLVTFFWMSGNCDRDLYFWDYISASPKGNPIA